jgi:hypothetical protein
VLQNNAAIMSVAGYFIPVCSYHFVVALWSAKGAESSDVKYWEIIVNKIIKAGFTVRWGSALDGNGRTVWIVDAHREGKRFVVHADERLTAFLELEAAIRTGIVCPRHP